MIRSCNLLLTLATAAACSVTLNAQTTAPSNTPLKAGSMTHGFKLLWSQPVEEIKATALMFHHEKSGAPLLYLSCEDDNKVFCIAFRTPAVDNTGIAHIMEHSVLCGSEKFPSKEPFVDLLKGSLQTFLNAFTADDRTMYPVASRNDKDLQNLMDVYLDAVFFPKLMDTPEILMQEGWHYQIDEETGQLRYNGIVYNEMKGVYSSPSSILYRTIQKEMYPDSSYANDSGGDPAAIPELTQDMFKKFHDTYYHPSNSLIYLYGNGNVEKHLEFIDREYLRRFDKIEFEAKIVPQPSFGKPKDVACEYSIDPGDSEADKTFLSMNYLLPTALDDAELAYGMDLLTYILVGSEAAPLKRALLDAGIGMDIQSYYDSSILQPCFSIIAKNANPEMKDAFLGILEKTLRELVEKGIDRKLIEGAINRTEFVLREFQVSGFPKGLAINMNILETWTYGGDPLRNLRFDAIIKGIRDGVDDNFFENLIRKYMLENPSRGFVMLKPRPGLEKENAEKLAYELDAVKKSLTEKQIEEIRAEQAALVERQAAPDRPEDVAKIPTLGLEDIDRDAETIPFKKGEIGDSTFLNTAVDTNKIVYITVYFDAMRLPNQYAQFLAMLDELLARVDTENYSYADLNSEIDIHTGGISTNLFPYSIKDEPEKFGTVFTIKTKVMLPKLEKGLELIHEILYRSKFDDLARIKEIVQELRVGMEQAFLSQGHRFAQTRSASYFSPINHYRDKIGGIAYHEFLTRYDRNFDEKGKDFTALGKEFADKIFIKGAGGLIGLTLSEEDVPVALPVLEKFEKKLRAPAKDTKVYDDFVKNGQLNEAVVVPSMVQYVVKSADYRKAGFRYSGKMLVLTNILRTGYLWNNIRVQGGAYGGGVSIDRSGALSLWSYRDPHLKRTVDVYDGVADYLEKLELSEEELTKAIIATIGGLDRPLTPSEKGGRIVSRHLSGLTMEDVQRERDEVLATTVEDLRNFASMFRECMKQDNICVFGNEQKLEADKSLFKTTIRPIE